MDWSRSPRNWLDRLDRSASAPLVRRWRVSVAAVSVESVAPHLGIFAYVDPLSGTTADKRLKRYRDEETRTPKGRGREKDGEKCEQVG